MGRPIRSAERIHADPFGDGFCELRGFVEEKAAAALAGCRHLDLAEVPGKAGAERHHPVFVIWRFADAASNRVLYLFSCLGVPAPIKIDIQAHCDLFGWRLLTYSKRRAQRIWATVKETAVILVTGLCDADHRPEIQGNRRLGTSGAGGGSRTHTALRPADFESAASAIPPLRRAVILGYLREPGNRRITLA